MPLSSFMHHGTAVPITVLPLHTALSSCQGAAGEDGLQHEVKCTLRGMHIRRPLCAGVKRLRMCLYCPLWLMVGVSIWVRGAGVQCSVWEAIIHGVQRLLNNFKTARQLPVFTRACHIKHEEGSIPFRNKITGEIIYLLPCFTRVYKFITKVYYLNKNNN